MTRVIGIALLMTALGLLISLPVPAMSLQPLRQAPQAEDSHGWSSAPRGSDTMVADMQKRQAREANKQRQMELKRDSERLLQLATELKLQVDKSNEHMLSLDVMKKAEQIEKLAHSVREKMKGNP